MTPGQQLDEIVKELNSITGDLTLGIVKKKVSKRIIIDYKNSLDRLSSQLDRLIKRL
jgi:hypothetical protein